MKISVRDMLVTFAGPVIVSKLAVVYFGLMYSAYPGDGYGYGLILAILFTLFTFGRFIWKYRHHSEDEERRS